jgi:uncharacterized protein (DUF1800 family)
MKKLSLGLFFAAAWLMMSAVSHAQTTVQPAITNFVFTNGMMTLQFAPHPNAKAYYLLTNSTLSTAFATNTNAVLNGFAVSGSATNPTAQFYTIKTVPMSSNELLNVHLLNRLAYGPTPDELVRLAQIGPQAYIDEQLTPENLSEDVYFTHTNVLALEGKLLSATALLNVLITSNIVTVVTNPGPQYVITSNTVVMTNNGTEVVVFSNTSTTWTNTTGASASTSVVTTSGNSANINDFRALHILRAVGARRQLLEVLLQFLENHFVTQYSKSSTYLNGFYNGDNGVREDRFATQWEYLENSKWRQALLDPNCTFYDLLRISCESPAMIVYLDSVNSRSNGSQIANENYAREILELFTFGVDNGYDQNDITVMSRSWAGWSVNFVLPSGAFNPFAAASTTRITGGAPTGNQKTNFQGVWAFNFNTTFANTTNKWGPLFAGKTVPARFGPPWAGQSYQLDMKFTNTAAIVAGYTNANSTNAIKPGYTIISNLCNAPFTMEFISVKLCRLFVHDNFPNPTTTEDLPEYAFYDYTNPELSEEAALVRACMTAWDTPGPDGRKGNIRSVLRTIFNSELFRNRGTMTKIKTPLEFAVSTIRALRANTNAPSITQGGFTARTDGYGLTGASSVTAAPGTAPLTRMGNMLLFERDAPDGYPETAAPWISAGTLAERLRFVQSVMIAHTNGVLTSNQTGKSDSGLNNVTDPVGLLRAKLPSTSWTNAPAVADFFIGLIFPGEGAANLNQYRTAAINFLNTSDNGLSSAAFNTASQTGTSSTPPAYDTRVRGMVAMLLTFQRFQEQ